MPFDFCTKLRMCLEALFFATFVCVKLCNKYQGELLDIYFTILHTQKYFLLRCNVGKFKSDLQVVTENYLVADTIIIIVLFCTFSIISVTFCVASRYM